MTAELPVAVIGGGPVGLAAAAHLVEHGLEPVVVESGDHVGAAMSRWGHIRLFSPWQYNIDAACRRLLRSTSWTSPRPTALPTGAEVVEHYLQPLAETPEMRERVRVGTRATGISRAESQGADGIRPFVVDVEQEGRPRRIHARAVVDASGTWHQPNPMGRSGSPASGEHDPAAAPHLLGALPDVLGNDRSRLAGQRVLVVGSGHSAVNTLLNLAALKRHAPSTEIRWAIRGTSPDPIYGGSDADQLPERGALGQRLRRLVEGGQIELLTSAAVERLRTDAEALLVSFADGRTLSTDKLISATGFRPDLSLLSDLQLDMDSTLEAPRRLAPLIDPALHSCGTVRAHGAGALAHPEEDLFIAGTKSYGRAPTFLLATGYEQVRSIAAHLAGRDSVPRELGLPQTGVCSA
ncbi:FAD-dependent oxidoreductase [Nesterenkonia populi]|uniref:FAD-dependent oxidoreductase n=1 Tax=Nesterenkonia populi TaxID=1591087 RepID=UPI0011BFBE09|nr:FAD-dependent oxidoreductase [Nesterenkonia populi]